MKLNATRYLASALVLPILLGVTACGTERGGVVADRAEEQVGRAEGHLSASSLAELHATIKTAMTTYGIPGAAVAVVHGDEIVYMHGFGERNLHTHKPVTPNTLFRMASVTKSMTSAMLATLVDDGVLDWDQPVAQVYPGFTLADPVLAQTLRVRDLMTANSGLVSNPTFEYYAESATPQDLMTSLASMAIVAPPYTEVHFSSQIYAAAGYVGALATGAPFSHIGPAYDNLMFDRLLHPTGMNKAVLTEDFASATRDYATGYAWNLTGGKYDKIFNRSTGGEDPADVVGASVKDVARFVMMNIGHGVAANGAHVISRENLEETYAPGNEITPDNELYGLFALLYPGASDFSYAMGWARATLANGALMLDNPGAIDGYATDISFFPDTGVGVVVLTNADVAANAFSSVKFQAVVRGRVAEMVYGMPSQVVASYAAMHQQDLAGQAAFVASVQSTFDHADVAPYLGDYEKGWRVKRRQDQTLWLVREQQSYQLIHAPGDPAGSYQVGNMRIASFTGQNVTFTETMGGMTMATFGVDTVAKLP